MFSFNTKVSYSRVDRNGKVPLHEIMNYLQDCTNFHSEALGAGVEYMASTGKAWVIVAYKIIINRPIVLGQDICVGTTPTKFGGMFASRQFFIKDEDGEYLVQADTIWILMDLERRKPTRITEEDASMYETETAFEGVDASRKVKFTGKAHKLPEFNVKKTYIDNNGHMNNADYLRAAQEFLPENFTCHELDIVYNKEAFEGQTIVPYLHEEEDGIGITFESQDGEMLTKIKLM
ncbi:MAG: acyl-[acyl-carrier-protein] thioesterase [Eubacterium sp.]